jgi:hypothetical protein
MMQAADSRQSDDLGVWRRPVLGGSPHWRIPKPGVDSVGVVIRNVFAEKASKVVFVQDHHMIQ